jgi:hypothetical protein
MRLEVRRYAVGNTFREIPSSIRITELAAYKVPKPRPQFLHSQTHLWIYLEPFHRGTQIEIGKAVPIVPAPTGHSISPPGYLVNKMAKTTSRKMTNGLIGI